MPIILILPAVCMVVTYLRNNILKVMPDEPEFDFFMQVFVAVTSASPSDLSLF